MTAIAIRKIPTISMTIYSTVIVLVLANLFLSADALNCHQCNSHRHEDCIGLRLNTPRAPPDNQYLTKCEGENAFCRKTVTVLDVTGERRIDRSCGTIQDSRHGMCYDADDEGFHLTICTCDTEGCNSAPTHLVANNKFIIFTFAGIALWAASLLRGGSA